MKIVKVAGGLGNQMFQYAFARALEERTGDEVYLDLSTYEYMPAHNGFELDRLFAIQYRAAREEDVERLATHPHNSLSQIRRKYFTKRTHHIDRVFRYDPSVFELKGDRYFEGWWQSEQYFTPIAGKLREEFRFIAAPGARNEELIATAEAGDKTMAHGAAACETAGLERRLVSVHVRRGDTLKHPDTWVCTGAYYRNAFALVRESVVQPHFLVFSDDLSWCRANLGLGAAEATYVDWNRGSDSWRDLWLMSRCHSHIIANSSFSWWGAWLDPAPYKLVLAPERWSLAPPRRFAYYHYDFWDIVPATWVKVPIR